MGGNGNKSGHASGRFCGMMAFEVKVKKKRRRRKKDKKKKEKKRKEKKEKKKKKRKKRSSLHKEKAIKINLCSQNDALKKATAPTRTHVLAV